MSEFNNLTEKKISSEEIFDGKILHVQRDTVELPNGEKATREVIRHVGAVCIVPLTDDGNVIVERQFRYPLDKVITEIPAGKLDSKDEDRLEAAKRELREETGITADRWQDLGFYYPAAAYTDEVLSMYLAQGLHYGKQELDNDEFLNFRPVPLDQLVNDIISGRIADGKTQAAILKTAFLVMSEG
ncbi:MAG: NUDIX hydrolase [Clostridia bacterium]|nr:NUDIX hydrolase [Clostridia bacterium]